MTLAPYIQSRRQNLSIQERLKIGLVGYWPVAENGAIALLPSVRGPQPPAAFTNSGTATRGAGPGNNLPDAGAFASASSQFLQTPGVSFLRLGGGSFHITGWAFLSGTPAANRTIASQYETTGNQRSWQLLFGPSVSAPTLRTSADGSSTVIDATFGGGIGSTTWAFIRAYFDATRGKTGVGINLSAAVEANQTAVFSSTGIFCVGARANGGTGADFMDGRLQGLMLHKRLLTPAELFWLYNGGQGRDLARGC